MRVVMLGSGNTATVLSNLIEKKHHKIVQVISRTEENAKTLAASFGASTAPINAANFAEADLYICALNDAALDHIEKIPALKGKLIVHTAGSSPMDVLKNISSTYGVLYPLQSLSKNVDYIPEIPFLIDGNTDETREVVFEFAKTLSGKVVEANDDQRLHFHVAAVFVNNFTNHLYALAESYCKKEAIDFKTLYPLMEETAKRAELNSPLLTQTGPAIRNDVFTLNRHLQALNSSTDLKYIYLKLTESIIKHHGKK